MPKLLLISFLIFINIPSFADNTEIITYLDKRESQALQLEDNLTQTEETLIENLNQQDLAISYFEADSSDKLEKKEESDINYNKILTHYQPILNNRTSTKIEKLKSLKEITKIKIRQDKYDEIIQMCRELLYEYPQELIILQTEAEAHHLYATQYLSKGELDLSLREYEDILSLNDVPQEWHAFSKDYIAHLYLTKGDYTKALYWYNRIIQDHPNLKDWPASAHYSIAQYYLSQNNKTKAKEELQTVITKYPNSGWVEPAKEKLRSLK